MGKKCSEILFAAAFLGALLAAMAVTIWKPKEAISYYENRALAPVPALSGESVLSGKYFSEWEAYLADCAAGRTTLVRLKTALDAKVLRRPVVNDVAVTEDMLLGFNAYETVDEAEIAEQSKAMADRLAALDEKIQAYGGKFYYVAVPGQYTYFADRYPAFLNNREAYTQVELACFRADLAARGVALLDMGPVFDEMGDPPELYSRCDYHYTYRGAYQTYRAIMDAINADRAQELTVLKEADLTFRELANPFMGSRERKLYNVCRTGEALTIALPNEPVPFTRRDDGVAHPASVYSLPGNDWENVLYGTYMGGDVAETVIETGRPQLPSILVYGDSFTNPVETLLYYSFDTMRTVDLRGYREMSLTDYVEAYRPDIVICIRDYEALLSTDGNGSLS